MGHGYEERIVVCVVEGERQKISRVDPTSLSGLVKQAREYVVSFR